MLDANANHHPTEKLRIAYVASRLGGDADEQTYAKRRLGAPSPYQSLNGTTGTPRWDLWRSG